MVTRAHNNRARPDKLVHTEYQPLEGKQPPVHFGEKTGFQAVITSPWVMRWAAIPATYATYRTIRKNATVALARELAVAPVLAAEWTVERSKDASEEWKTCIEETFMPLRDEYLATALYYGDIDFGYQCWEKIIEPNDGYLKITRLKQLLHDITEICIGHKGGFIGVRQLGQDLGLANSIHVGFRVEGSYLYGIPLLENVRQIYNWWTDCNEGARRYDRKIAGCHIVVEYPEGTCTNRQGKEVECAVMAAEILDTLESAGGVSVPRDMAAYMQVLNTENPGWKIWILDAGGNQQTSFASRLEYLDKQFCRGLHIPERAMMEGRHGTLAEAQAHGDVIFTIQDIKHRRVTDELNRQGVNQVLYLNFGSKAVGKVRLKASPIADQKKQYFADLYKALLGSPAGAQELGSLDLASIRDQLGLPTVAQDQGDLDQQRQQGQPNLQAVPGVSAGVPGGPGKRLMVQGSDGRPVTVDGQSLNPAAELANAIAGMREAVALSSTALKKAEAVELRAGIAQAAFSGGTLGDVLGARGLAEQAEDINGAHALPDDRNASDFLQGQAVAGRTVEVAHSVAAANGGGEPLGLAATDPVEQPPWESEWEDDPHSQLTKDIPLPNESSDEPGHDFIHFSAYRLYRPEIQNEPVRQEYGLGHPFGVSFGRGPEQNMDITGEGKAGRIISHFAQALRELLNEHRPLSVHFTGTTPSHIHAYHHMLGRLAGEEAGREYKFLRKPGFGGGFHIVHRAAADAPYYARMREIQPRRVREPEPAGFANLPRGMPPGMLEVGPSADRASDADILRDIPVRNSDSDTRSAKEQAEFLREAERLRAKLAAERMERKSHGLALDDTGEPQFAPEAAATPLPPGMNEPRKSSGPRPSAIIESKTGELPQLTPAEESDVAELTRAHKGLLESGQKTNVGRLQKRKNNWHSGPPALKTTRVAGAPYKHRFEEAITNAQSRGALTYDPASGQFASGPRYEEFLAKPSITYARGRTPRTDEERNAQSSQWQKQTLERLGDTLPQKQWPEFNKDLRATRVQQHVEAKALPGELSDATPASLTDMLRIMRRIEKSGRLASVNDLKAKARKQGDNFWLQPSANPDTPQKTHLDDVVGAMLGAGMLQPVRGKMAKSVLYAPKSGPGYEYLHSLMTALAKNMAENPRSRVPAGPPRGPLPPLKQTREAVAAGKFDPFAGLDLPKEKWPESDLYRFSPALFDYALGKYSTPKGLRGESPDDLRDMTSVLSIIERNARNASHKEINSALRRERWSQAPADSKAPEKTHLRYILRKMLDLGIIQPTPSVRPGFSYGYAPKAGEHYAYLRNLTRTSLHRRHVGPQEKAGPRLNKRQQVLNEVANVSGGVTKLLRDSINAKGATLPEPDAGKLREVAGRDLGEDIREFAIEHGRTRGQDLTDLVTRVGHTMKQAVDNYDPAIDGDFGRWWDHAHEEAQRQAISEIHAETAPTAGFRGQSLTALLPGKHGESTSTVESVTPGEAGKNIRARQEEKGPMEVSRRRASKWLHHLLRDTSATTRQGRIDIEGLNNEVAKKLGMGAWLYLKRMLKGRDAEETKTKWLHGNRSAVGESRFNKMRNRVIAIARQRFPADSHDEKIRKLHDLMEVLLETPEQVARPVKYANAPAMTERGLSPGYQILAALRARHLGIGLTT